MAKQKFRCEGVLRKTGQRVAVEVSAESKELALKLADQHGVTVQRIGLAEAPKPAVPRAAREDLDENDEKVDGLLDSFDPSDPFDLASAAAGPALSGAPAMKACPYCGEPILAVAIKCKHCGSVLPVAAQKAGLPQRAKAASSGGSRATRLILVAVAAVLLLLVGGAWAIWHFYLAPVATSVATVLLPPPPAPKPQPSRPEEPKASPAEIAYAAKLLAFLDACDATTRLLDESPKLDACRKQNEALNACYKAIETPPKGVRWAEDASTAAKELMQIPNALMTDLASLKDVFEAAGQSVNDNPGLHDAYSKASASMRQIAGVIRNQIPAACLPKSR